MKSQITPFPLRLPPELRTKLDEAARILGRSLQSEIVARLDQSFYQAPLAGLSVEDVMKVTDHVIKTLYADYIPRAEVERPAAPRVRRTRPSKD